MNTPHIKSKRILPIVVISGLILAGGVLTGARIHGFSFAAWHSVIDGSPQSEVFFNKVNRYRTDDWIVMLPHILAQRADRPPFAAENRLIGDGHYNMLITGAAPVRDPLVLFRPQVWGYFISGDVGMAFQWWFYVFGVWLAVWLVLRRLTDNDELTSTCGATALLFSPFFQAWSLNCAPTVIFACGTLLALARLRAARTTSQLMLATVMLAWFGTAFLLTFYYLPYLVTLLYFIVFVFAGMALTRSSLIATINELGAEKCGGFFRRRRIRLWWNCSRRTSGRRFRPIARACLPASLREALQAGRLAATILKFPCIGMAVKTHAHNFAASREAPQRHLRWPIMARWAYALLAVLCILGMGAYLFASNGETIAIVRNSDYPGQRLSSGGDQIIWPIFRGNVLSIKPPEHWLDYNPCEGAAFFLIFPLVVAALLRDWWRTRKPPNGLLLGITGYIVFLLIWNLAGFPEVLARWTFMSRAPPFRTMIGLGIADIFLLSVYVSSRQRSIPASRKDYVTPWVVSALWIAFHVALEFKLSGHFPDYFLNTAVIGGLFAMALAPLLYLAPRLVLPAVMIVSILTTYPVNPLARGGTAFIQTNPLSQKIRALDQEAEAQGRQPVWIAYGGMALPNLFRMIGARALNGTHAYSQLELWKTLDPEGLSRPSYNRYAHVVFEVSSAPDDFKIKLVHNDSVTVFLHPDNPRFAALNVDYLLCMDNQVESFDRVAKLKKIYSYAGKHIYRVERAP